LNECLDRAVLDVKTVNPVERRAAPRIPLQHRHESFDDLPLAIGFFITVSQRRLRTERQSV
jgi:hypothetical protein